MIDSYTDLITVSCEEPYRFSTRIQYQERNRYAGSTCQECSEAARKNIVDQKRNILIQFRQAAANNKPDLATLDLRSTIYLLAIIYALSNEDLSVIEPLNDYTPITPCRLTLFLIAAFFGT